MRKYFLGGERIAKFLSRFQIDLFHLSSLLFNVLNGNIFVKKKSRFIKKTFFAIILSVSFWKTLSRIREFCPAQWTTRNDLLYGGKNIFSPFGWPKKIATRRATYIKGLGRNQKKSRFNPFQIYLVRGKKRSFFFFFSFNFWSRIKIILPNDTWPTIWREKLIPLGRRPFLLFLLFFFPPSDFFFHPPPGKKNFPRKFSAKLGRKRS